MDSKVAIIGADGQLGRALVARFGETACGWSRQDCDLTDSDCITARLDEAQPDVVINAAAYNQVDAAEDQIDLAWNVNARGPERLARACSERGIRLVHIGTDYVFGNGPAPIGGWKETDLPMPQGQYAASKLAGDLAVLRESSETQPALVVRTCGLYGAASPTGKRSFVNAILDRARTGQPLRVVHDQRCTPTHVEDLVDAIVALLPLRASGLIHYVNGGECTWFEFAREVLRLAGIDRPIEPILSSDLRQKAARPVDSRLSTEWFTALTGHPPRPWREALARRLAADGVLAGSN
jgi:dTDP-4-dehydrorhamnose reductase